MNKYMELVGKKLNLKGHFGGIGDAAKFIYGPTDIEGNKLINRQIDQP